MRKWSRGAAVVGTAIAVAVLALAPMDADARERRDGAKERRLCRSNLMRVGEFVYGVARSLGPDESRKEGWLLARLMETRDEEILSRLQCRADPLADARDASLGFRTKLSYAVRDLESHRLAATASKPQILVVCPHHDDGAFVMTDDFDIRFMTRAELGAPATGPLEIGAKATHPALASVRFETQLDDETERKIQRRRVVTNCAKRLRQLGGIFSAESMYTPGPPPYSGPALFVHYRQKHHIQMSREEVLMCPLDTIVHIPKTAADSRKYDELDLTKSLRKYISFAVRDFDRSPLRLTAREAQSVAACVVHPDGANVLYDDGAVVFRSRKSLGLGPGDKITVGPDSKSTILRPLTFGPPKKD